MRKFLIVLAILIAAGYYARRQYTAQDVLAYSKSHPDDRYSPALDYYIGMGYFLKSRYEPAAQAFSQLLTDYPTCQYAEKGFLRLGESYEELRQWTEAKETYQKYLDLYPDGKNKSLIQNKIDVFKGQGR